MESGDTWLWNARKVPSSFSGIELLVNLEKTFTAGRLGGSQSNSARLTHYKKERPEFMEQLNACMHGHSKLKATNLQHLLHLREVFSLKICFGRLLSIKAKEGYA